MRGRKTQPTQVKELKGTRRPDRENPAMPEAAKGMVTPPEWLPEDAHIFFEQLAGVCAGIKQDSPTFGHSIAIMAERVSEIVRCNRELEAEGEYYKSTKYEKDAKGNLYAVELIKKHPAVNSRSDALRHLQSLLAEHGLTPSSLSKVGSPDGDTPLTGWEAFN